MTEQAETAATTDAIVWAIGIVPVQTWISEATRSRDLRFGSLYLSHVAARVIKTITELHSDVEIVLPRIAWAGNSADPQVEMFSQSLVNLLRKADSLDYSLPNRATGIILEADMDDVEQTFATLDQRCLVTAWTELIDVVTENSRLGPAIKSQCVRDNVRLAIQATENPLQLVWCLRQMTLPVAEPERGMRALVSIDEVYAAVKRTRPVGHARGTPVGKCSTCGARESISPPPSDDATKHWSEWRQFRAQFNQDSLVVAGRRFDAGRVPCGVCAAKRLGGYLVERAGQASFPSTAAIAASNWRALAAKHAPAELSVLDRKAKDFEGSDQASPDLALYYYRRSLDNMRRTIDGENTTQLRQLEDVADYQTALYRTLGQTLKQDRTITPSSYLAAVVFDGDDMGLEVSQAPVQVSTTIDRFVRALPIRLDKCNATPFYVGGDEGLILLPVDRLLQLAMSIGELWMQEFPDRPTLSMGACVFDFAQPLRRAIEMAHTAIATAKRTPGKASLAVTVQTASGSAWTTVSPWGAAWDRIAGAQQAILKAHLASGWAYDVQRLVREFENDAGLMDGPTVADAIRDEIKRLTRRHYYRHGEGGDHASGFSTFWSDTLLGDTWLASSNASDYAELAEQMQLVSFLARTASIPQVSQTSAYEEELL